MFGDDTEYPYGYNLWAMGEEEDRQNKEDDLNKALYREIESVSLDESRNLSAFWN